MNTDNPYAKLGGGALDQMLYKKNTTSIKSDEDEAKKQLQKQSVPIEKKMETEEVRMTLPLSPSQLSYLHQIERDIFSKRSKEYRAKERLTKNNVVRAWLKVLEEITIYVENVADEEDLYKRMKSAVKV